MNKNLVLLLSIIALLVGCSAPATPSQTPVASPTQPVPTLTSLSPLSTATPLSATQTSSPTYTAEPPTSTSTPESGLQLDSPHFAYFRSSNARLQLVFMNPDGKGSKVIDLPKELNDAYWAGTQADPDIRQLSPDGKWLAYYTGSAGEYGAMPAQGTADLTLNLMNVETGETQVITPLLSKDYPNNFTKAAKQLNDPYKAAEALYDAFVVGIVEAIDWSPDGQHLAFAGQMDGLSSDLYVYDVQTEKIQRLSSGDQELQWINWSPDGKRIIHSGVFGVGEGMTYDIYVATLGSSVVPHISNNVLGSGIEDWLNDHQYFENDGQNGPGPYGLRMVDINTGKITKIWDGSFSSYAVDKNGTWAAIIANSSDKSPYDPSGYFNYDPNFVPAIYLINLTTLEKKRIEYPDTTHAYGPIASFGLNGHEFVIGGGLPNANVLFLSAAGELTQSDLGDATISVSPNSDYWLAVMTVMSRSDQKFFAITDQNIKIFSKDDALIKEIPFFSLQKNTVNAVIWRPDSSGLLMISNSNIFSMDNPDGDIESVATDLLRTQTSLTYKWINDQ